MLMIILTICSIPRSKSSVSATRLKNMGKIICNNSFFQEELAPIMDRVRYEITGRYHLAPEFNTSKPETIRSLLEHIDQK